MHPQYGQRSHMLTSITDEQCLRFRHTSKAFYTTALKLEVMKTAVVPTAHFGTAPTSLVTSIANLKGQPFERNTQSSNTIPIG